LEKEHGPEAANTLPAQTVTKPTDEAVNERHAEGRQEESDTTPPEND